MRRSESPAFSHGTSVEEIMHGLEFSQTSSINSQSLLPSHAYLLTTPPARLHSHLSAGLAYQTLTSP